MKNIDSLLSPPLFCNEEKTKRIKRFQQKERHLHRQVDILENYGIDIEEPHILHKKHAMNCGNPDCVICANPRKAFGEKTIQERRNFQSEE